MKKILILCLSGLLLMSCASKKEVQKADANPFFSEYGTPFNVPSFEKIKNEHYMPAFEKGMAEHKAEIEAILTNTDEPDFENTVAAMDKTGKLLGEVSTVFFSQNGAYTNDELQKIAKEISPRLSAHNDEIRLNDKLFARIKVVYDKKDTLNLNEEQMFVLENLYKSFVRNGANLDAEAKEELKKVNQELSKLTVAFGQNLLAETNSYQMVLENKEDLAGLPDSVIEGAADAAKKAGHDGKWMFTTHKPSMIPFLQFSEKRELREKLYRAYFMRGNNDNDHDNKKILADIANLRLKRANILGYKSHAAYTLENRMAKNAEGVYGLLDQLWEKALPNAEKEAVELQKMIDKEGGNFKLASWDWWYYAEKLRKEKYDLDESQMRPYFKLENVRDGAFMVANRLYGITFTEIKDIPVPHPDAQAFEVKEADGSHLGVLYMDFHPRASKRQGAWCGGYREHKIVDGKEQTPIVTIVCNFTKPSGETPSLLSLDEVETLFHEFGHGLDGLFSECSYGMNYIAWDFVELPSQIMEHWSTHPEVMKEYAKHYKTGEAIPDEMVEKIKKSSLFNQGFATVEYLAASLLDMKYHTLEQQQDINPVTFEEDYLKSIGLIPEIISRYKSTYFAHIFSGSAYSAGYYSYIWAGVLDNDAFDAFNETDLYNKEVAESFRNNILAKNGIKDAATMYRDFRGRDPKIDALLKNRGLN